jgi:nucleotide-binding universal stress UspA family protein
VKGKTILLATDGSVESECAAREAIEIANGLGLELRVVNVAPVSSVYAAQGALTMLDLVDTELEDRLRTQAEHTARATLNEQVLTIKELGGKVTETHSRVGRPDVEIVRLAEELEAGLVVAGNRGSGPFKRDALGSVCESVVRHAPCPVLVVRYD